VRGCWGGLHGSGIWVPTLLAVCYGLWH
jgi:hypothetical protein